MKAFSLVIVLLLIFCGVDSCRQRQKINNAVRELERFEAGAEEAKKQILEGL